MAGQDVIATDQEFQLMQKMVVDLNVMGGPEALIGNEDHRGLLQKIVKNLYAISQAGGGGTIPATTAVLKGDGTGNAAAATDGTDYLSALFKDPAPKLLANLNSNGKYIDAGAGDFKLIFAGGFEFVCRSTGKMDYRSAGDAGFTIGSSLGLRNAESTGATVAAADPTAVYFVDATAGNVDMTLPIISSAKWFYPMFVRLDSTTNRVRILPNAANTIAGASAVNLLPRDSIQLSPDQGGLGTLWYVTAHKAFGREAWFAHADSEPVAGNNIQDDTQAAQIMGEFAYQNAPALNDAFRRWVYLRRGTYNLRVLGITDSNRGIQTWSVNGTSIGTMDWYAGVSNFNVLKTINGFSVPYDGVHEFKSVAASKNGASSNYYIALTRFAIQFSAEA